MERLGGHDGDPGTMPRQGQLKVGVQGAGIFAQDFKDFNATVSRGAASYSAAIKDAKITGDQSFMASVAYGVNDRFSVYAELGVRDGGRFKFSNWDAESGTWWSNKFKLRSVLAWALGAKVLVFESPDGLGALLAAQYQRYDDRKTGDMDSLEGGTSLNDFKADYWQANAAVSLYKKLGPITPYVGWAMNTAQLGIAGRANLGTPYANHLDFGDMKTRSASTPSWGLGLAGVQPLKPDPAGRFHGQDLPRILSAFPPMAFPMSSSE